MRVYANVDMWDDEGMGFRVHSVQGDTVSLQNIDVEIRRIRLDEITSVLPYFPKSPDCSRQKHTTYRPKRTFKFLCGSIH